MAKDPFRLRVLQGLTKTIEGVNPDNGYEFDLRDRVFRGRMFYGENDPLPMVSILEPPIPLEALSTQPGNPHASSQWELLVQGFVPDDHQNPSDPAYRMMAEVKSAIVKERINHSFFGFGFRGPGSTSRNSVNNIQIGQGAVRPADEVSGRSFFWLSLLLQLTEDLSNPYS